MKTLQVLDAVETLSQLSMLSDKSHPELMPQPERIKNAFRTLDHYLCSLYKADEMLLKNHDYLASLKAVMVIAEEAYDKLDLVSAIFHKQKQDLGAPEFDHLYDFYLKKIGYKVEHVAGEVFRHAEEEKKRAETDTHGLKNLEEIRKDTSYELFYIKDEEGLNHFSKNLLRHTQLLGTFDELFLSFQGDDPFIKLKFIEDRIKQKRAAFIKQDLAPRIDYFIKEAYRFKKNPFIAASCRALYALFLSSYPSLVLQNDPAKATFEYFQDLLQDLSYIAVKNDFYRSLQSGDKLGDKGIMASQRFIVGVVSSLFFSKNDIRYVAEHLYQFVPRPTIETFSPISFFDKLLEFDTSLRTFLKNFPSGPLMKALDFVKDPDRPQTFSPLRSYLPQNLFTLLVKDKPACVINMGSPTIQADVKTADIDPLFQIFSSQLKNQRTLVIDLEDGQSSASKSRLRALVKMDMEEAQVSIIPRSGLFYDQHDVYAFIDDASEFKAIVLEQVKETEGAVYGKSGLYKRDIEPLFDMIHKSFFDHEPKLCLKNRLVFIEILQLLMSVSLMERYEADNLLIICKDGIDHSNVYALGLYSLIKIVSHENLLKKEEFDFFISEIYGPAMMLRDRPIFEASLVRMISALSHIQAKCVKDPSFAEVLKNALPALKHLRVKAS